LGGWQIFNGYPTVNPRNGYPITVIPKPVTRTVIQIRFLDSVNLKTVIKKESFVNSDVRKI
jgi:hypothetical protein